MTAWDGSGAVFGLVMRVARLGSGGAPLVGTGNQVVTSAFTKIDYEPEYQDGTVVTETNAAGELCLNYTGASSLLDYKVTIEICSSSPELMEILSTGSVLLDGPDVVGYASPDVGDPGSAPNGLSIESWSRAVLDGGAPPSHPYLHWAFPRVRNLKRTGVTTIGPAAIKGTFEGIAVGNTLWADGPQNDWPIAIPSSKPWQFVRTDTVPAAVEGYGTTIA